MITGPRMTAVAKIDCYVCGLTICVGNNIMLGEYGYVHEICAQEPHAK